MKKEYWDVTDEQVIEKTGQPLAFWIGVLDAFGAMDQSSNDIVNHLQKHTMFPDIGHEPFARATKKAFDKSRELPNARP